MSEKIYKVEEFVEELERLNENTKETGEYWTNNYRMMLQYRRHNKTKTWRDIAFTIPKLTSTYVYKKFKDKEYLINEDEEILRYVINDRVRPIVMKYIEPEGSKPEVHTDYEFKMPGEKEVSLVCPDCFREECICPKELKERREEHERNHARCVLEDYGRKLTKEDFLIEIDTDILPLIQLLNDKGYGTRFCCSGHPINFYIYFRNDFEELKDCPIRNIWIDHKKSNNCYNRIDNKLHYDYIFYRNNIRAGGFEFEAEFPGIAEMLKWELIDELMMWAKTLPHAKINWLTDCCYMKWY